MTIASGIILFKNKQTNIAPLAGVVSPSPSQLPAMASVRDGRIVFDEDGEMRRDKSVPHILGRLLPVVWDPAPDFKVRYGPHLFPL